MTFRSLMLTALLATSVALASADRVAASRATCMLQSDLVTFQHGARGFLEHLKHGNAPGDVTLLRHWLEQHSVVNLRMSMRRAGLETFEPMAVRLITQQKGLLQIYDRNGTAAAMSSAERLNTAALLNQFARRIIPLACDLPAGEVRAGSGGNGAGGEQWMSRETAIATSFTALILGGAGLVIGERLARRHRRRSKRYPCSLPCSLQTNQQLLRAKLVDISRMGAKVRIWNLSGSPLPAVRSAVTVAFPAVDEIQAQVIWQSADYVGVNFTKPMSRETLQTLLKWSKRGPTDRDAQAIPNQIPPAAPDAPTF